ncbi:unnamed protein product [Adineta steineri]|uniref:C2 domain-containing protein n=1 Tax=Adineta steineri TaxID=433720 RepID=A0A813MSJ0_9BILA|nr:unnamed protein product [Adineta steineri]
MIVPMFIEHPDIVFLIIGIIFLTFSIITCLSIYLCTRRTRNKNQSKIAIDKKRLIYSSPTTSITPQIPTKPTNQFVYPLTKLSNNEISMKTVNEISSQLSETPSNYKTFNITKRYQRHLSSDSSYTSSNQRRSYPSFAFETIKSKIQQVQQRSTPSPILTRSLEPINSELVSVANSSDSDEQDDNESLPTPTFEYSLTELFRIELIYKLHYSIDDNQLSFQLIRLVAIQPLIERCFPSLICKIRLYTNNDKRKNKKYFSKKDPINEIFKFDINQYDLEQSYLKIHVLGHHKNDKRIELGHTSLILNQYDSLMIRTGHHYDGGLTASEQHIKSIQIDEDRIDMITQQQVILENEARALICLVYENDRCLLQVGLIKIVGIQSLFKLPIGHSHHRDLIQIKICTIVEGKITGKRKSKAIPIDKNVFTFSTSFHFEYLLLHKTSIRITICYRKTLLGSHNKPISSIEFGSNQVKNQQIFQHWTDTLSSPNRPHVHWHSLQLIDTINHK